MAKKTTFGIVARHSDEKKTFPIVILGDGDIVIEEKPAASHLHLRFATKEIADSYISFLMKDVFNDSEFIIETKEYTEALDKTIAADDCKIIYLPEDKQNGHAIISLSRKFATEQQKQINAKLTELRQMNAKNLHRASMFNRVITSILTRKIG